MFPIRQRVPLVTVVDLYPPSFPARSDLVGITEPRPSKPVYQARALDRDLETTCSGKQPCDCAQARYAIVAGNHYELFSVDNVTGSVQLDDPDHLIEGVSFPVTIGAWTPEAYENGTDPDSTMQVRTISKISTEHGCGESSQGRMRRLMFYEKTGLDEHDKKERKERIIAKWEINKVRYNMATHL